MKRLIVYDFIVAAVLLFTSNTAFPQKQGQALVDSLREKLTVAKNDTGKVRILFLLAEAFSRNNYNPDSAISYANQELHLAEKLECKTCISEAHNRLYEAYYSIGNYKQALAEARSSKEAGEAAGNKFWIANAYVEYAAISQLRGEFSEAIEYYYKALRMVEKIDHHQASTKALMSKVYTGIGNVCISQHSEEEALKNYFAGLKIDSELNNKTGIAGAYNNIANVYCDLHKYSEAICHYNLAIKINKETGNKQWLAFNYTNVGEVNTTLGNYREALECFKEGITICDEIKDTASLAMLLTGVGCIYIKLKNFPDARKSLIRALLLNKKSGTAEYIKDTYRQLTILDSATGHWKSAFENQKQFILYRDSMNNNENVQKLTQNQMQYKFDKKEAIAKEEAKQQRNIRNMSFAGMGVLLLFTLVVVRQRNTVRKGKKRSDELLLNILPAETAEELKATGTAKAKDFEMVTVMFTDFRNFSVLSKQMNAQELVNEINYCYSAFDNIIGKYGIEKIKTIGDSYMCAGGLPVPNKTHAFDVVNAAIEMRDFMLEERRKRESEGRLFFEIKIGIHTGPVVAGIVGIKKFAYDIWGDTVNLASRMESADEAGKINISEATYALIKDKFACTHRGKIHAKNMGEVDMYFVEKIAGYDQDKSPSPLA